MRLTRRRCGGQTGHPLVDEPIPRALTVELHPPTLGDPAGVGLQCLCNLTVTYPVGYIRRVDALLHALSDPSRRRVLEALGEGEASAGELAGLLPIARPGVSRHLRVLREAGLVDVRQDAQRRVYSLRPEPLAEVDNWLARYRSLWEQRFDALHTEVARGKRQRRNIK